MFLITFITKFALDVYQNRKLEIQYSTYKHLKEKQTREIDMRNSNRWLETRLL